MKSLPLHNEPFLIGDWQLSNLISGETEVLLAQLEISFGLALDGLAVSCAAVKDLGVITGSLFSLN